MSRRIGNRLLDQLDRSETELIFQAGALVTLSPREWLITSGGPIASVYFPLDAVISLLTRANGHGDIEVVTVGNEGLVGLPRAWGVTDLDPLDAAQVLFPGRALRIDAERFQSWIRAEPAAAEVVASYTSDFVLQLRQQVVCSGLHSIEQRIARWILSAEDKLGRDQFPVTQEFLAQMLGVRRPSVTTAARHLQLRGCIDYRRGQLRVLDRAALERESCDCYQVVRTLFGASR